MVRRKTNEEYVSECKEKGLDLPIEEYKGAHTPIKHMCKQGHVYKQKPNNHLSGNGCPKCYGTPKKTTQQYIKECKQKGYDLPIEEYKGTHTKINHMCKNCGNSYSQRPNDHLKGQSCPKCGMENSNGVKWKTTQQYIKECKQLGLDLPIENYIDAKTPINHMCKQGHVYKQAPYYRLHYYCGCPICSQSHGEKFIQNYLDKHNIPYITQKKFNNLKDKALLSYDFYLPKQKVLIEYQGKQHFIAGGNGNFDKNYFPTQQYHDKLKRDYAVNNGYTLLEPTYKLDTQEKINNYLDKYL